jgi:hypothetical protein
MDRWDVLFRIMVWAAIIAMAVACIFAFLVKIGVLPSFGFLSF